MSGKKAVGHNHTTRAEKTDGSSEASIIVGDMSKLSKIPVVGRLSPQKRWISLAVAIILLVIVGIAGWHVATRNADTTTDQAPGTYKLSDEAYAKLMSSSLKKKAPAADALVSEKRAYYDQLMAAEYEAKDYQGVVDTYEQAVAANQGEYLAYGSYSLAAKAYIRAGEKQRALDVITKGEAAVKSTTTDEDMLQDFLKTFTTLRQEAAK